MAYQRNGEGGYRRKPSGFRRRKKVCVFCAKHQRALTLAVKRARHLAILPYVQD